MIVAQVTESKDEVKRIEDQNKALVVSVKDGYDWIAYAELFTSNLMTNLALVAEVVDEDWSKGNDPKSTDAEEEDDEYDLSDKSDPISEIEAEEMNQGHDTNVSEKGNKDEEVALMAQS
ncbi:hypothetical protein QVD17_19444 [Tagetes erecta]|uniref:Uncharacterized protein n=1 Tax=Tagetes erecta TaxID=13708 RepID=A0AAD8NX83_TARER|nr:hypothetical protein QVD17_19444 [Tagetes erecta]